MRLTRINLANEIKTVYDAIEEIRNQNPDIYNLLHDVIFNLENVNISFNIPFSD